MSVSHRAFTPNAHVAYALAATVWTAFGAVLLTWTLTVDELLVPFALGLGGASVLSFAAIVPGWWNRTALSTKRAMERAVVTSVVLVTFAGGMSAIVVVGDRDAGAEVLFGLTGFMALALPPLRTFAQQRVETLLFGDRGDAYEVITSLGRRLETAAMPDDVLPGVVENIAAALRLPFVAIELESQTGVVVAATTGAPGPPVVRMPLTHQARCVGWLVLATRAGEPLAAADHRLLKVLAGQIGVAARTVQLAHDLQRSHALLVAARDEERQRLQRDLHDGLGPMLAGVDLAVQAARNLLSRDPTTADALLARVVTETRAATADVRRLVYDLRPPAIDRLGLVGALREQVLRLGPGEDAVGAGPAVTVEATGDADTLAPAVETAAFRIATEAFVNVRRHANARTCTIRLRVEDALHLEVVDDGDGIATGPRAGVGITSMRERAAELGGTCTVTSTVGGGTRVHAILPIASASAPV